MKPLAIASLLTLLLATPAAGGPAQGLPTRDTLPWGVELQVGLVTRVLDDPLTRWLSGFPFRLISPFVYRLGISRELTDLLTVLVDFEHLEARHFHDEPDDRGLNSFGWSTYGAGAHFRVNPHLSDRLTPYAQLGGGFAWSPITTRYEGVESSLVDTSHFFSIAVGFQATLNKHLRVFLQATYEKAEVARTLNTVGGTTVPHDSGGFSGSLGVRATF